MISDMVDPAAPWKCELRDWRYRPGIEPKGPVICVAALSWVSPTATAPARGRATSDGSAGLAASPELPRRMVRDPRREVEGSREPQQEHRDVQCHRGDDRAARWDEPVKNPTQPGRGGG